MTHHFHVSVFTVLTVMFSLLIVKPIILLAAVWATNRGMPIGPALALV